MKHHYIFAGTAVAVTALGFSALAVAQGRQAGPVATYWMTAETTSGMGAMMSGRGAGGMMGALMSGRATSGQAAHTLHLQLGSSRTAAAPSAEHIPPAGLGAGASLPLLTPQGSRPPARPEPLAPGGFERPKGRLLIYWGCGEKAPAGQPVVIDFARMTAGQAPPAFAGGAMRDMTPPSPERSATYGEWPNQRSRASVPARGSLVGEHVVRGNYTPEIRFTLGAGQDFLAPLIPRSAAAASGATLLSWPSVPTAKAYSATVMGAARDESMIMWSSSATQMGVGIPDYLDEAELARLVANRTLMGPAATSCAVPAEVTRAAQGAMLMMTAYGPQSDFSYPPRPAGAKAWSPEWVAKLRSKSTHMTLLGVEMPGLDEADGTSAPGASPPKKKKRGLLGKIGEAVEGELPH